MVLCVFSYPLFFSWAVCFYVHFGYLVYSSTAFNLCVADIHILYFKHISIVQLRRNVRSFSPVFFLHVSFFISANPLPQSRLDWSIIFKLVSLNVKGLSDFRKRRTIFVWCWKRNADFVFLHETHSTIATEKQWKNEWGAETITCHGGSNSRGVCNFDKKWDWLHHLS